MGTAIKRVTTTHRHEYRVPAGCAVEIQKALGWVAQDFAKERGRPVTFDDDVLFDCDEESVAIYFLVADEKRSSQR